MGTYRYEGPIYYFGRCIQSKWMGETSAVSERRARANLSNQWKRQHNRTANTKISLPGELMLMTWRGEGNQDG